MRNVLYQLGGVLYRWDWENLQLVKAGRRKIKQAPGQLSFDLGLPSEPTSPQRGQTRTIGGKTYRLNANSRWERVKESEMTPETVAGLDVIQDEPAVMEGNNIVSFDSPVRRIDRKLQQDDLPGAFEQFMEDAEQAKQIARDAAGKLQRKQDAIDSMAQDALDKYQLIPDEPEVMEEPAVMEEDVEIGLDGFKLPPVHRYGPNKYVRGVPETFLKDQRDANPKAYSLLTDEDLQKKFDRYQQNSFDSLASRQMALSHEKQRLEEALRGLEDAKARNKPRLIAKFQNEAGFRQRQVRNVENEIRSVLYYAGLPENYLESQSGPANITDDDLALLDELLDTPTTDEPEVMDEPAAGLDVIQDEPDKKNKPSKGFKGFEDPWAIMSPEDRKEANRLLKLSFKAFPNSPKQKKLSQQLQALLYKYGIGGSLNKTADRLYLVDAGVSISL